MTRYSVFAVATSHAITREIRTRQAMFHDWGKGGLMRAR